MVIGMCLAGLGCGHPPDPAGEFVAGLSQRDLKLGRFTLRYHAGGERYAEIAGDSASLWSTDRIDMDSVTFTLYRNNLSFLSVSARSARAAMVDDPDTGQVSLADGHGELYFGGRFSAAVWDLSLDKGLWRAAGSERDSAAIEFIRPPLSLVAESATGSFRFDVISARRARLFAQGAQAVADHMKIFPASRQVVLDGNAGYESDTVQRTGQHLKLEFDPTFSRLNPVGDNPAGDGF